MNNLKTFILLAGLVGLLQHEPNFYRRSLVLAWKDRKELSQAFFGQFFKLSNNIVEGPPEPWEVTFSEAQIKLPSTHKPVPAQPLADTYAGQEADLALARRFSPIFHQRFTKDATTHRFDFITNFDFDGDWTGNNNWEHAADSKFPMKGYVYYSVIESQNYYFITYADFHARDWSLLQPLMDSSMDKVQASEKWAQWLPPQQFTTPASTAQA